MAIHSDPLSSSGAPERIVAPQTASPNEASIERALRPRQLKEYVGQKRVREQLEIFIAASRQRHAKVHVDEARVDLPGGSDAPGQKQ